MKFSEYIRDKLLYICILIILITIISLLLILTNTHMLMIIFIPTVFILFNFCFLLHDYVTRKTFYDELNNMLNNLQEKYYITEIINSPTFLEGNILCDILYEVDKSMIENINNIKINKNDFKEYIELWCHEIKIPIATIDMIINNNSNDITLLIKDELDRIDNYVEQSLFYARSDYVDKDYIICQTSIIDVVNNVLRKNKKELINKKIKVELINLDVMVNSDSKWLEFIINQIVINSIKYFNKKKKVITFAVVHNKNNISLSITDNGCGIKPEDIDLVFNKGFTGNIGRKYTKSTGIGLYLCKKLCNKLNHEIELESVYNEYTKVCIIFPISSMVSNITNM
ncbi:MAG: ATP-binding protein [bacterium]|nr:ATP-binding protein [bacterium]